jgi:hypothetical protein
MNDTAFFNAAPCNLLYIFLRFEKSCCLYNTKMDVARFSETWINSNQTAQSHISGDNIFHSHRHQNLTFHMKKKCPREHTAGRRKEQSWLFSSCHSQLQSAAKLGHCGNIRMGSSTCVNGASPRIYAPTVRWINEWKKM